MKGSGAAFPIKPSLVLSVSARLACCSPGIMHILDFSSLSLWVYMTGLLFSAAWLPHLSSCSSMCFIHFWLFQGREQLWFLLLPLDQKQGALRWDCSGSHLVPAGCLGPH